MEDNKSINSQHICPIPSFICSLAFNLKLHDFSFIYKNKKTVSLIENVYVFQSNWGLKNNHSSRWYKILSLSTYINQRDVAKT